MRDVLLNMSVERSRKAEATTREGTDEEAPLEVYVRREQLGTPVHDCTVLLLPSLHSPTSLSLRFVRDLLKMIRRFAYLAGFIHKLLVAAYVFVMARLRDSALCSKTPQSRI